MGRKMISEEEKKKTLSLSLTGKTIHRMNQFLLTDTFKNRSSYIEYIIDREYDMRCNKSSEHRYYPLYQLSEATGTAHPMVSNGVDIMLDIMRNELSEEFSAALRERNII